LAKTSSSAASNSKFYIGYWKPYATSHDDLDGDIALQREVQFAAKILSPQKILADKND
jgi:hypothetical protein